MDQIEKLYLLKKKNSHLIGPSIHTIEHFLDQALDLILPGMVRKNYTEVESFNLDILSHQNNLKSLLQLFQLDEWLINQHAEDYLKNLLHLSELINKDAIAILDGDPAATDLSEVLLTYPGLSAIATYRIAHYFYHKKLIIFARMLTEVAHTKTGIDIHPGAKIGVSFFIDHGTGVVIGETAIIGNRVKLYQGVTLGALSVDKSLAHHKRHPTIEDDCIIYAHATILGADTVIGEASVIGGNVWLTKSVPKNSIVYHRSEIKLDKKKGFNQEEEITYEI
jgi:serine O-acetyltransferase